MHLEGGGIRPIRPYHRPDEVPLAERLIPPSRNSGRRGGDIDAETTNGGIKAELAEVTPGKNLRLETTNGRISVTVPKSLAVRIDASTTNGSINTDLPVTTSEVRSHALRGTINGGGSAELRLRTTNGSIMIEAR